MRLLDDPCQQIVPLCPPYEDDVGGLHGVQMSIELVDAHDDRLRTGGRSGGRTSFDAEQMTRRPGIAREEHDADARLGRFEEGPPNAGCRLVRPDRGVAAGEGMIGETAPPVPAAVGRDANDARIAR